MEKPKESNAAEQAPDLVPTVAVTPASGDDTVVKRESSTSSQDSPAVEVNNESHDGTTNVTDPVKAAASPQKLSANETNVVSTPEKPKTPINVLHVTPQTISTKTSSPISLTTPQNSVSSATNVSVTTTAIQVSKAAIASPVKITSTVVTVQNPQQVESSVPIEEKHKTKIATVNKQSASPQKITTSTSVSLASSNVVTLGNAATTVAKVPSTVTSVTRTMVPSSISMTVVPSEHEQPKISTPQAVHPITTNMMITPSSSNPQQTIVTPVVTQTSTNSPLLQTPIGVTTVQTSPLPLQTGNAKKVAIQAVTAASVKIANVVSPNLQHLQATGPLQSQPTNILSQNAGTTIQSISTVIQNQSIHGSATKILGQSIGMQAQSVVGAQSTPQMSLSSQASNLSKVPNFVQGPIQLTTTPQMQLAQTHPITSQAAMVSASPSRGQGPEFKYICCLLDNGVRCDRIAGNASYSRRVQKTVGLRKLNYTLDPNVRHAYICEHHKSMIQSARKSPANARETAASRNHHLQEAAAAAAVANSATTLSPYGRQANNAAAFLPQHALMNHNALNSVADLSTSGRGLGPVGYSHYSGMSPLDASTSGYMEQHLPNETNNAMDVDLYQLQVNTLRRYKRHFRVQTRPGLNKLQLAESLKRHFKSIPVLDKEAITYFVYMVKCNRNKLDHNVRCPTSENR